LKHKKHWKRANEVNGTYALAIDDPGPILAKIPGQGYEAQIEFDRVFTRNPGESHAYYTTFCIHAVRRNKDTAIDSLE
jgi:hypothetical protein